MIIAADGSILIDGGHFSADSDLPTIERLPFWSKAKLLVNRNQIETYRLNPVLIDGLSFSMMLIFHHEHLAEIQLVLRLDEDSKGWDGWSVATEAKRKEKHDALLNTALGRQPWTYPWGQISSVSDPKTSDSVICIQYNEAKKEYT